MAPQVVCRYKDSFWNGPQELCLVMSYCEGSHSFVLSLVCLCANDA